MESGTPGNPERMGDPVSWLMVERGWSVLDRSGEKVGTVEQVLGDQSSDIFNGLAVSHGLVGRPRYVPSERVASIHEGSVELSLDKDAFEQLDEHDPVTT